MERKSGSRGRVVNLRPLKGASDRMPSRDEEPLQEIVGIGLGDRMVFSELAEVWTVRGHLRDGTVARDNVGELCFVMIPGGEQPATSVVGFIAPSAPYVLGLNEDGFWAQLRSIVVQLGYDLDGFYASIALGGRYTYLEDFRRDQ